MKHSEKEKYIKNARKSVGRKYKFRQSDYVNWKIKDGFFFCLETFTLKETKLFVKPLYMDDLYWKMVNPFGMKWSDHDRWSGVDGYLIWKEQLPKSLVAEFSPEQSEQIWEDIYQKVEREIASFLQKYPHPDCFSQYVAGLEKVSPLTEMLIKVYERKTDEAYRIAKACIDRGEKGNRAWSVPGEQGFKHEYEFILDYCLPAGVEAPLLAIPSLPAAPPVQSIPVQKNGLKLTKAKLIKAVRPGLEKLGYVFLKDSITGAQGLFGKKLPNGLYLTLAMTIHRLYDDAFTADFELSKTASVFGIPGVSRKRPGYLLTKEELAEMNETTPEIWWSGLDAESVSSFIALIQKTEPSFLTQEGMVETIQQSPVEEHYYQRSLLVREWAAKGVPEMDYECLPTKCVDHIPMEWFKAAEYVLLEREEYLSLNACMVKILAGNAYRQSVLDGLI